MAVGLCRTGLPLASAKYFNEDAFDSVCVGGQKEQKAVLRLFACLTMVSSFILLINRADMVGIL